MSLDYIQFDQFNTEISSFQDIQEYSEAEGENNIYECTLLTHCALTSIKAISKNIEGADNPILS